MRIISPTTSLQWMYMGPAIDTITRRTRSRCPSGWRDGFTLVEMLVIIAVVTLLVALLLPSLKQARASAHRAVCLSTLRQWGVSHLVWLTEHRNGFISNDNGDYYWDGWTTNWYTTLLKNTTPEDGIRGVTPAMYNCAAESRNRFDVCDPSRPSGYDHATGEGERRTASDTQSRDALCYFANIRPIRQRNGSAWHYRPYRLPDFSRPSGQLLMADRVWHVGAGTNYGKVNTTGAPWRNGECRVADRHMDRAGVLYLDGRSAMERMKDVADDANGDPLGMWRNPGDLGPNFNDPNGGY